MLLTPYPSVNCFQYLRTGTFEEEMLLWRRFLDNKVLLSCGKAFECSEPGWFRIIFADKTHRLQLGEWCFLLSITRPCLQLWPPHSLLKLPSVSGHLHFPSLSYTKSFWI